MLRYRVPRIVIDAKTTEFILNIPHNTSDDVRIEVTRRKCSEQTTYTFEPYHRCDDELHFEVSDEFIKSGVPNGFYDGIIYINDCESANIEITKGGSRYVKTAKTVDTECHPTNWEEPDCVDEDESSCGSCDKKLIDNGCPSCLQSETIVATHIPNDYIGEE